MAKKSITIQVSNPCHEKWSKMTADGKGKFCASCNKTVVDFSKFTDNELAEFFKKLKGAVCGSFNDAQLNRPIPIPVENSNSFLSKALFGTALLAGMASHSDGQTSNHTMPFATIPIPAVQGDLSNYKNTDTDTSHIIKGKVISARTRKPLSDIDVAISGTRYSTYTDSNGKFELSVPEELRNTPIVLTATDWTYRLNEKQVPLKTNMYDKSIRIALTHRRRHRRRNMRTTGYCQVRFVK